MALAAATILILFLVREYMTIVFMCKGTSTGLEIRHRTTLICYDSPWNRSTWPWERGSGQYAFKLAPDYDGQSRGYNQVIELYRTHDGRR